MSDMKQDFWMVCCHLWKDAGYLQSSGYLYPYYLKILIGKYAGDLQPFGYSCLFKNKYGEHAVFLHSTFACIGYFHYNILIAFFLVVIDVGGFTKLTNSKNFVVL